MHLNTNKRSAVVDADSTGGADPLEDLLARAAPGRSSRPAAAGSSTWGLTWSDVHARWPASLRREHQRVRCHGTVLGVRLGRSRRPGDERSLLLQGATTAPSGCRATSDCVSSGNMAALGALAAVVSAESTRSGLLRRLRRHRGAGDPPGAGDHHAGAPVPRRRPGADSVDAAPRDAHPRRGHPVRRRLHVDDVHAAAAGRDARRPRRRRPP